MPYRPTTAAARVQLDPDELERSIATFCANQGIKSDAEWDTFVNTITADASNTGISAGLRATLRAFLKKGIKLTPPGEGP